MTATTLTLTDFLLARIAEDEVVARDAWGATWHTQFGIVVWSAEKTEHGYFLITEGCNEADGKHMARHDPARVLAECEAKRRIVELSGHPGAMDDTIADRILEALALPYADHPDYRPEWRP